ncbi:E3 ubiquitin-protein ligase RNF13 isoform X2 [Neocloeon triangulifer]|uniref:E3 ubiquitin-protein ligase RNF13 isoform X2 n=1 Tax=Neocloeon triangulifer TaxID=2078957 RepID=UPI00286F44B6|nr:E3 ubiquitin-protein ligase RNF13 isoform X2 [Neocloeon triangulifer]
MYPQSPLPRHITALYMVAIVSLVILCHAALAGADVLVFSRETHRPIEDLEFRDLPARFGERLPFEGLKGLLVYSNPPSGCPNLEQPPNVTNYTGQWIALIRRYDCNFEDKIRNAQRAGYDAVIVHNVNSSDLEIMSANYSADIYIPSVFVGEEAGWLLRDSYQYQSGFYILINDDLPFNINTHLLLPFAIVVGICFLVTLVFMIVKCVKDYRRERRHRLPTSSLRQIPTSKFVKGDPYETCAICLEDYIEGDKLRILPCSHAYHSKCIDPWLTKSRRVCPVCKRKVFARDERIMSDTDSDTDDETAPLVRSSNNPGTTGGGTFSRQRDNPFRRAMRRRDRRSNTSSEDSTSVSSAEGSTTGNIAVVNAEQIGQSSNREHSINGEPSTEQIVVVTAENPMPSTSARGPVEIGHEVNPEVAVQQEEQPSRRGDVIV